VSLTCGGTVANTRRQLSISGGGVRDAVPPEFEGLLGHHRAAPHDARCHREPVDCRCPSALGCAPSRAHLARCWFRCPPARSWPPTPEYRRPSWRRRRSGR
jgi:hypothetical protein